MFVLQVMNSKVGVVLAAAMLAVVVSAQPLYGGKREFRSINTTAYEISIQRNGKVDFVRPNGDALIKDAHPRVVFADKPDTARRLRVDGRYTMRTEVNDRLGKGQGMLFARGECEWQVQSYVVQPFAVFQVAYVNTSRKPVQIAKLIPLYVDASSGGLVNLGADAANTRILDNGRLFLGFSDYPEVHKDKAHGQWNVAAYNPVSGQSLVVGFLTNDRAYTQIRMERGDDDAANAFGVLHAECVYDPPVTLQPGERLEGEMLYVALTENNPHIALERYGKAYAVINGVKDERPFIPHGWDSWSTRHASNINEEIILRELDALDTKLKRYGWNHFAIDAGWEKMRGDWEPHPERFPNGMKAIADAIHARGMTAGLWIAPFWGNPDTEIVKRNPEWFVKPGGVGKMIVGENTLILDPTHPDAYAHVRDVCRKITQEWGFDALVETDFVYYLLMAEKYHDPGATKIDAMHRGMSAIREGIGADKFIMATTPLPVNGIHAQGLRVGMDCKPVWRSNLKQGPWGVMETLSNAARRYYMTPHLYVPDQDCVFFGHEPDNARWRVEAPLRWEQSIAWLTGAALTGGAVKLGNPFSELTPREVDALRRVLPSVERPAVPLDLFDSEHPKVWHLPMSTPAGDWHIVALFNWSETESETFAVPLAAFTEKPEEYHTVYDFWPQQYLGTVQGHLRAEVPPASVRLFGLRSRENRPMLIASDSHFTQGALDHTAITWNEASRTLSGSFNTVENTAYTLTLMAPEGYSLTAAESSLGTPSSAQDGNVVTMLLNTGEGHTGTVEWKATF